MKLPSLSLISILVAASLGTAMADVAISFTGTNILVSGGPTIGWAFTLALPTLVTDLGYIDLKNNTPGFGDGLNYSHPVGIWTSAGALQVQGTVPAGTAGSLVGMFRYISITPTLLLPGSYVIGGLESVGPTGIPSDVFYLDATSITTPTGITYNGGRADSANNLLTLTFPDSATGFYARADGTFGPNFQFLSVPEPSTWLLLLGGLGLISYNQSRRKITAHNYTQD